MYNCWLESGLGDLFVETWHKHAQTSCDLLSTWGCHGHLKYSALQKFCHVLSSDRFQLVRDTNMIIYII